MGFRENLLKKMAIDDLAAKVAASIGPPDSGRRIDKTLARQLLAEAGGEKITARDLELYRLPPQQERERILVLDNDLPIYATSVADVALRKSPTVKEMLNLRNVVKILKDEDVVISKKDRTVQALQAAGIAGLDLNYTAADIAAMAKDGSASLGIAYAEGVQEGLRLFSELLGCVPPPPALQIPHHDIRGQAETKGGQVLRYGPLVAYSRMHNTLVLIKEPVNLNQADAVKKAIAMITGQSEAPMTGAAVFAWLQEQVPASPGVAA